MKTVQLAALAAALAAASAPPVSAAANGSPAVPIPAVQAPAIHTGDDLAQLCADPRAAASDMRRVYSRLSRLLRHAARPQADTGILPAR
jgi:hypothetical protein